MEHKNSSSGFSNGLMLGLVIGAGLVLLLTTKKGKKLLRAFTQDGLDSLNSLEDIYKRFEKVTSESEHASRRDHEYDDDDEEDYPRKKPILIATESQPVEKIIDVEHRLEQKIHDVSEVLAQQFVPYADDESDIEEEEVTPKVKITRRRFFRGIPRRN